VIGGVRPLPPWVLMLSAEVQDALKAEQAQLE
jgi:hypothetical protein